MASGDAGDSWAAATAMQKGNARAATITPRTNESLAVMIEEASMGLIGSHG
jgi:hypothetical protein